MTEYKVDQQRRNLVKGLGAATLASSVMPGSLFASEPGPTAVIIGAGIAGLSAAWDLRKAGFQVSIFEKEKSTLPKSLKGNISEKNNSLF